MNDLAWGHGPHVRIRQATPEDLPIIRGLAPQAGAGVELERPLADGVTKGFAGAALKVGVHDGVSAFHGRLANLLESSNDLLLAYLNVALVLVADHDQEGVVGTLLAYPPIRVIEQARPIAVMHGASPTVGVADLAKVKALVVTEAARRERIGSELLRRCRQVFFGCGYKLIYGQIEPTEQNLKGFYQKRGFTVLDAGETIPLWPIFGVNAHLYAEEGQRLFMRERIS